MVTLPGGSKIEPSRLTEVLTSIGDTAYVLEKLLDDWKTDRPDDEQDYYERQRLNDLASRMLEAETLIEKLLRSPRV